MARTRRPGGMAASLRITGADLAQALAAIAAGPHSAMRRAAGAARRGTADDPCPLSDAEQRYLDHAEEEDVDRTFRGRPRDEGAEWW
ncbi:MAG: hypothetical protein KIS96_10715 [Bauldia sp.]|nr:hypothetical protein [Bauldia sp.]